MNGKYLIFAALLTLLTACKKDDIQADTGTDTNLPQDTTVNGNTPKITIYNKGVIGSTSTNLVTRIDKDVLAIKPKLVIILIGTNDVTSNFPSKWYHDNLNLAIERIQKGGSKVVLLSPPPRGTQSITFDSYSLNDHNDSLRVILTELSTKYGCYYLDVNAEFRKAGTPNATANSMIFNKANNSALPDGIHFTEQGSTFLANLVDDFLKSNHLDTLNTIVCFGDSLTAGAHGITAYPTKLNALLNSTNTTN